MSDERLLEMRICELGLRFEETPLVRLRDQLYAELKQRKPQDSSTLLVERRLVFPRWRSWNRDPVLHGSSETDAIGTKADAGSRGRNQGLVLADPAT